MIVQRYLIVALMAAFALQATSQAQSSLPPEQDTQEWNDFQLSVPVTQEIDFNLLGTLRLGRHISRAVDERIGVGFTLRMGQHLSASPSYLHISVQPFEGRIAFEERVSFPITVRLHLGEFTLSERNLYEHRVRRPGVDSNRYRNKVQLEYPMGPPKMKLSLFVADEVFYDWGANAWVRNRASIGVVKVFNKHLTADLYYLRQNDSHSQPGDLHVIGLALRFRL
jgi:hypothetical protein